eukprot:TRINITY_DN47_c0_g1_i2.p1 TRINITY_DN47_c0_g1~~TRINITY_DN47_c0_g1_i2.p1  ORF type:complete len:398 (-),score=79.80 TRINITY_DN47_c0_g1_i2:495-1688(-)
MSNLPPTTWRAVYICIAVTVLFFLCVPWIRSNWSTAASTTSSSSSSSAPSSPISSPICPPAPVCPVCSTCPPIPPTPVCNTCPPIPPTPVCPVCNTCPPIPPAPVCPPTPVCPPPPPICSAYSTLPPTPVCPGSSVCPSVPGVPDCPIDLQQLKGVDSTSVLNFADVVKRHLSSCFGDHLATDSLPRRLARIRAIHSALTAIVKMAAAAGGGIEGFTAQLEQQTALMARHATERRPDTICEIGFNGGHSSVTWLVSADAANYTGFDLGTHVYGKPTFTFINALFPNRMQMYWGDSTKTVPAFKLANPNHICDLAFVDGGHYGSIPQIDVHNMLQLCNTRSVIAMDDITEGSPCDYTVAPGNAWGEGVTAGWIVETERAAQERCRGLVVGRVMSRSPV